MLLKAPYFVYWFKMRFCQKIILLGICFMRKFCFALSLLIVFAVIPTCASADEYAGNITWSLSGGVMIIGGYGDMRDFDLAYGYDCPWRERKSEITEIIIKNGVTSVGDGAFSDCANLENVDLPVGLISIGNSAFFGCGSLKSVRIPDSVTNIGGRAFEACGRLADINIPDGVKRIGGSAFSDTAYYNDPQNRTDGDLYIGKHLIEASPERTGKYEVRGGTKCIADKAFFGNENITSVEIPDSAVSIGAQAFFGCCALTSVKIGRGVNDIGAQAFSGCGRLNIEVPSENAAYSSEGGVLFDKNKTEIIAYARDEVQPNYNIPSGVERIGAYAFQNCENLAAVIIPASVKSVGSSAFMGCAGIKNVYYLGSEEAWKTVDVADNNDCLNDIDFEGIIMSESQMMIGDNKITVVTDLGALAPEDRENAEVYAALYDKNGAVIDAYSDMYYGVNVVGELRNSAEADHIKVFVWCRDGSLCPLTDFPEYILLSK